MIMEREKRLSFIIENTELLRESLSEHRNSLLQARKSFNLSRSSEGLLSSSSSSSIHTHSHAEYESLYSGLNRYKEVTRVLQRHLADVSHHPVAFLLTRFSEIFASWEDARGSVLQQQQ